MKTLLAQHKDTAYALLRIVSGFLFLCHGAQKLFGVMGGTQRELMSLMGLAGAIEFFGGLALMLGLMTGIVAFISSGQMAVAYFMAHQFRTDEAGMMLGWLPIENRGELAVLYCFLFLFIAMAGAGKWSLDNR
jgi:putative oxidoreductase